MVSILLFCLFAKIFRKVWIFIPSQSASYMDVSVSSQGTPIHHPFIDRDFPVSKNHPAIFWGPPWLWKPPYISRWNPWPLDFDPTEATIFGVVFGGDWNPWPKKHYTYDIYSYCVYIYIYIFMYRYKGLHNYYIYYDIYSYCVYIYIYLCIGIRGYITIIYIMIYIPIVYIYIYIYV